MKKTPSGSYELNTPLSSLSRLSSDHESGLLKLGIVTIKDLLFHLPSRYMDLRGTAGVAHVVKGQAVTIYGIMEKIEVKRSFHGHIPMTTGYVADNTGRMRIVWFNQAYIGKMYPDGTKVRLSGIVQEDKRGTFLSNPQIEKISVIPDAGESLFKEEDSDTDIASYLTPVYRETKGVSSLYLYSLIKKIFHTKVLDEITDPIPETIYKKLHLPSLKEALLYAHLPKNESHFIAARKRFAFEEIFYMQVKHFRERSAAKNSLSYKIKTDKKDLDSFVKSFPFTPTQAQRDAIDSILKDIERNEPMGRLLEGDVGSGKTFVAATVANAVIKNKGEKGLPLQVAYMAPTEILAKQHLESFIDYFKGSSIEIGLLTGSGCLKYPSKSDNSPVKISRSQLLKWVSDGKISILIGTHALIQKSVQFRDLALIIIDEQHRFGVKQRKSLAQKTETREGKNIKVPHLLSMTATPIPRTLALTMFGDLDLTVIDTMPKERKQIITEVVHARKRQETYEKIRKELQAGRQVYVICPRIDEQDEEEKQQRILKSVKEEAKRLSDVIFPEFVVDIIHSKMKKEDKEEVMEDFLNKKSDILVATSVVEVGVNIPNATVIIIEHAERFGLAQLHQLRGRVGRSHYQSYCYLFSEGSGEMTKARLKALVTAKNGFELAEQDMLTRGIGALVEGKQWGISDLAMEAIKNPKLVEIAREEARRLVETDPDLKDHKELLTLTENKEKVHME